MSWLYAARARLRLLFARGAAEARMNEEIGFHIDMEMARLVREQGVSRDEARRRALIAFGGVQRHREELRDGRGLAWLAGMTLDLKLGLRMMLKYPGLTVVGVLGMAVAVAIGAVSFAVIYTIFDPPLPLDGGDRVVAIQNLDARRSSDGRRTHLHDLATWREALETVEDFGAYRTIDRNLISLGGRPEPVRVAEMTASGFRIARVPPLKGRYFHEEDERPGAPPVVVIGHSVWQSRFAGEPEVVGRTIQLGTTTHTVVGVMPRGFAFPINNRIWTPLRLVPSKFERGEAPPVEVFGRLAPAATLEEAQTQLTTIGRQLAAAHPETHQHIRPRVLPYPRAFIDTPEMAWMSHLIQLLVSMLLVVIGTNVAILVYARTASRAGEIAMRTALGASRGRIVAQLFAEALVLSAAAAAVGLVTARFALQQINDLLARRGGEQVPFWMDFGISPGMVLYVAGLTVLGAVIVGVVPALKVTRRHVHAGLQQLGGGSGMRLGRIWTVLIVAQVAVAVAILPVTLTGIGEWVRHGVAEPRFATKEFLTASLHLDRDGAATDDPAEYKGEFATRYANLRAELVRRLEVEPGVADVVLTSAVPGDEPSIRIEVEGSPTATMPNGATRSGSAGHRVGVSRVDLDFFGAFGVPILAGRGFEAGDLSAEATAVIVNQSFVKRVLEGGGGDALGRRVRVAGRDRDASPESVQQEPWYEIVGVVPDFPTPTDPGALRPKLYQPMFREAADPGTRRTALRRTLSRTQPMLPEAAHPVTLAVRVRGAAPATFAGRLEELTVAVDPMLRLGGVGALDESLREDMAMDRLIFLAVALLTLSVLLLSAAGIYAIVSFTIARRRREIGIRSALGAGPRRLLWSVLSRAAGQIAIGIVIGVALAGPMVTGGGMTRGQGALLLAGVAALMAAVGLIAAMGPARRALRIQPTEALKAD